MGYNRELKICLIGGRDEQLLCFTLWICYQFKFVFHLYPSFFKSVNLACV